MQKFTFNNQGFISLQSELYQLDDQSLTIEAELIRFSFDTWMSDHFEFTNGQLTYLAEIHPKAKSLLQSLTAFAIENRLPIVLNKTISASGEDQGKIIWPKNSLSASSGGIIGYTASGTLEINIDYEI